ncbi:hypothetical protein [Flavobacterium sp. XS2P39]|uniref:hypothetical protein n=1 Tax=Flavobacterium sp. XS2P39 TaxID=3401725 RepID=UPI003AABDC90
MLSQDVINDLWNKSDDDKETKWTFNDNGVASGSNGATANTGEAADTGEGNDGNQNNNPDPPTTSSLKDFFRSLFNVTPKSEEEVKQSKVDRDFFSDAANLISEVGDSYQTAMMLIFPVPSNPSSEIKASGWIARKLYSSLDPAIASKFVGAIGKGIVSPTGKQGIIRLTASEASAVGAGYTHKIKILGKGGDLRLYGKQLPNGHFVFDKLLRH